MKPVVNRDTYIGRYVSKISRLAEVTRSEAFELAKKSWNDHKSQGFRHIATGWTEANAEKDAEIEYMYRYHAEA